MMKANRTLKGKKKKSDVPIVCRKKGVRQEKKTADLLWLVGCDAGRHGNQSESQDEAQREVDEGGAAQQHGQVEDGHQLQHPPALLRALPRQQSLTNSTTHRSHSGTTTRTVRKIDGLQTTPTVQAFHLDSMAKSCTRRFSFIQGILLKLN